MTHAVDVIVIGGGLHGCSAALQLASRGQRVIVLERRHVARHASGINAGGVRTLNRDPAELPLSVAGMDYWHRIRDLVGDDCGFVPCGQVKVAESAAEMEVLAQRVALTRRLGYMREMLIDKVDLRRLLPTLAPHCVGGLIVRTDGSADPQRTTAAFAARARAAGAVILENHGVQAIEPHIGGWRVITENERFVAHSIVNAAGAWAGHVASLVGDTFPLRTRASMVLVTERMAPFVHPVVSTVKRRLSFKQTACGTVLIGGGQQGHANLAREEAQVDVLNLAKSAHAALALFPQLADARVVRSWCGIEAETPDHLPVIDRSPTAPDVIHVFGFSGHGFQLGPICGFAVADLVMRGSTALPIAPFSARRFAASAGATTQQPSALLPTPP